MSNTFDTEKFKVGSLLGRYERRRVVLPEYQRSYSWEKAQVSAFWSDLILFEQEYSSSPTTATYFLGSVVLIPGDELLLLLDGQQRLATCTIALAAMRGIARGLDAPGETKGADLARDIQRELIEKDTDPASYALSLGDIDEPYFLKTIKVDPPQPAASKLRSHVLLAAALTLSVERIHNRIQSLAYDDAIKALKSMRDALVKGMSVVGILVQDEEDAYTIFETLNDRGLRLSVPDLVLNLLMKRAPDGTARKLVRQHWNAMLRELGKRDVSRFLRHLWVSEYGDLKAEGLFAAIKTQLAASTLDSVSFAERCADECDDYVALLDANVSLPSKEGMVNLEGIVRYLRIAPAPPLLLAGWRVLSPHDFEKLLKATLSAYIRYVLVGNQNPLDLETAFYDAARAMRAAEKNGLDSPKRLATARTILRKLAVADAVLMVASDELTLERSEAAWLMTQLANAMQSATDEIGMDKSNLEHVFPQNATITAWPNLQMLEPLIWHIGNLTILGEKLNRKAQNKSFSDKSSLHYAQSEVVMTKELLKLQTWDEPIIRARGGKLVKQIAKRWPAVT